MKPLSSQSNQNDRCFSFKMIKTFVSCPIDASDEIRCKSDEQFQKRCRLNFFFFQDGHHDGRVRRQNEINLVINYPPPVSSSHIPNFILTGRAVWEKKTLEELPVVGLWYLEPAVCLKKQTVFPIP